MAFKKFFKKIKYYTAFTLVALVLAEIILSLTNIFPNDYYTGTPNSGFTWEIDTNEIIGINQNSEVAFDKFGARSISDYDKAKHKIAVFGGSTTACFALTQQKTWTALLEKELGSNYWVGNFGRPGNNSNHHVLQLEHILEKPELITTKTVLIMQGVNDLVAYLISSERYVKSPEAELKRFAFQHLPNNDLPFYKRLTLFKLASKAKQNLLFQLSHKDHLTKAVQSIKSLKKQVKVVDELPNLEKGLQHYENNIITLIKLAKQKNIQLVFIEQATMWKPNLESQYEDLIITSGFANNEAFYSTTALHHGMIAFNERLKMLCDKHNVPFISLNLPKTTESFYDDFHFNESGAKAVSVKLFNDLKAKDIVN